MAAVLMVAAMTATSPYLNRPLRSLKEAQLDRIERVIREAERDLIRFLARDHHWQQVSAQIRWWYGMARDGSGFIVSAEIALVLAILVPVMALGLTEVADFISVWTAAMQEHKAVLCASMSSPPPECGS